MQSWNADEMKLAKLLLRFPSNAQLFAAWWDMVRKDRGLGEIDLKDRASALGITKDEKFDASFSRIE